MYVRVDCNTSASRVPSSIPRGALMTVEHLYNIWSNRDSSLFSLHTTRDEASRVESRLKVRHMYGT